MVVEGSLSGGLVVCGWLVLEWCLNCFSFIRFRLPLIF